MKKSILLFVAVLATAFSSCSKDDNPSNEASLLGKWQPVKQGVVMSGQELVQDFQHTLGCDKNYVEFTNTMFTQHDFDKNMSDQCEEDIAAYSYSRTGNTISVLEEGELLTLQIAQLDATTLKLTSQEDFGAETPVQTILILKRM